MPEKYFGTQKCFYNLDTKICKTTINEPFYKAGVILGWPDASAGFGLNKELLQFVLKYHFRLIVHVGTEGKDYFITPDALYDFLDRNNTEYKVGDYKWLNIISWKKFTRFMPKVEA